MTTAGAHPTVLGPKERAIARSLAAAVIPRGDRLPGGDDATVDRLARWADEGNDAERRGLVSLLWAAELACVPLTGRPLSRLSPERARRAIERFEARGGRPSAAILRALLTPLKAAHFDDPSLFALSGCTYGRAAPARDEPARWTHQMTDGCREEAPLDLECEVVVVGTGAGGAACAYELASRGRAVVLLEEGDYHARSTFTARAAEMTRRLFRDHGMTVALGNVVAPVWAGRAVGGSTIINSGTCYRTPDRVLARWRNELGLDELTPEAMAPYFSRVESMLEVAPAPRELTGGIGRVIARGAGKLGYSHKPLLRNAPGCDAQGTCCFGCPTGAKRSTDVSYVPAALSRGAQLVTAAKVTGIDVEPVAGRGSRARGVSGELGSGHRFRVRADAVVIAGGALMTPVILKRAGACRGSKMLGKNLSIHPASKVMAVFDETIDMARAIPQGYTVDEFHDEGILFEGASTPPDVTAIAIPWIGPRFTELMERYRELAIFGFLIEDSSRGEVRPGPSGSPLITYSMNHADAQKMGRAVRLLSEIFLEAGAKRVLPMLPGLDEVRGKEDLASLEERRFVPSDFEITAYHPLGTCRIGKDPKESVLTPDHEAHELSRLFVTDGSAVPTALGVNPQITIMAMALRAAEKIDARL